MSESTVMELIHKLRSSDRKSAIQAIEELRARVGLSSGALASVNLRYVVLHGANLRRANLRQADLSMADLRRADLSSANLQGARLCHTKLNTSNLTMTNLQKADLYHADLAGARNVSDKQLAQASRLTGATMPDESHYDGRFNLPGDIVFAQRGGVNTDECDEMATFYGVSLDEYEQGQMWKRKHMTEIGQKA